MNKKNDYQQHIKEEEINFCNNVKKLCKRNNIELSMLAKLAKISETDVNRIETNSVMEIDVNEILKICVYFSVTLTDIFRRNMDF
ncbi:MAG: helix-turn-helix transcriptional regulator [Clostridiales bacterium]|jgi:DNA-binding Xre family transcriptional regulator|nr:helix-turn-helix transcriptional regulator [Clostridiales bacterium]